MEDLTTTKPTTFNDDTELISELDLYVKDSGGHFQKKRGKDFLTSDSGNVPQAPSLQTATVFRTKSVHEKRAQKAHDAFASLPWQSMAKTTPVPAAVKPVPRVPQKPAQIRPLASLELQKMSAPQSEPTTDLPSNLRQPLSNKSYAEFIYDVEDAEDIKKIEKAMPDVVKADVVKGESEQRAGEIVTRSMLPFDAFLTRRFSIILKAYFQGIRGKDDTIDLCTRSVKVGGLGLAQDVAAKIFNELVPSDHPKTSTPSSQDVAAQAFRRSQEERLRESVSALGHSAKEQELRKNPALKPNTQPASEPVAAVKPATPPQPPFGSSLRQKPERIVVTDPSKPKMADIQKRERVLGPVDEIRVMGANEYRALGETPQDAAEKIKEKIDLLGDESFTKRTEGINAWRESPLYQLYLSIGQQSMVQGADVNVVSLQLHQAGKPYLTQEEFMAIADLNHQLRY